MFQSVVYSNSIFLAFSEKTEHFGRQDKRKLGQILGLVLQRKHLNMHESKSLIKSAIPNLGTGTPSVDQRINLTGWWDD